MQVERSDRGFEFLMHPSYAAEECGSGRPRRLASQSSAVGDYDDSWDRPGSSFLWVGKNHHLNREEVKAFAEHLLRWVETGHLGES